MRVLRDKQKQVMEREYINQLTTEYSTGEREESVTKNAKPWADTLEEANE
jgi:hypothetical protein